MTTDKIYLVGFMAAGKSTVGRTLASRLGWRFEDVDDLIEKRERLTISEIFARHGEPHFRHLEREMLRLLLPLRHLVVATSAGTFADPDSRDVVRLDGVSVWLELPLDELVPRIPLDGRRPLATTRAQLERLYQTRAEAYRLANIRVAASRRPPLDLVEEIVEAIAGLPPVLPAAPGA